MNHGTQDERISAKGTRNLRTGTFWKRNEFSKAQQNFGGCVLCPNWILA
jgi:hypothetical protein